jgi:hypothetical protein
MTDEEVLAKIDAMLPGLEVAFQELRKCREEGIESLCGSGLCLVGDLILDLETVYDLLNKANFTPAGGLN